MSTLFSLLGIFCFSFVVGYVSTNGVTNPIPVQMEKVDPVQAQMEKVNQDITKVLKKTPLWQCEKFSSPNGYTVVAHGTLPNGLYQIDLDGDGDGTVDMSVLYQIRLSEGSTYTFDEFPLFYFLGDLASLRVYIDPMGEGVCEDIVLYKKGLSINHDSSPRSII